MSNMRNIIQFIILSLLASVAIATAAPKTANSNKPLNTHEIALIDAGNGGTSLYVYAVSNNAKKGGSSIRLLGHTAIPATIAAFFDNPQQVGSAFSPLWQYLDNTTTHSHLSSLPIYFWATANADSLVKQQAVYSALRDEVKNHPHLQLAKIETITRQQLGIYWWLTVNRKLNTLTGRKNSNTVGVVDVGSQMTEVAFAADKIPNYENDVNLTLGARHYHLFIQAAKYGFSRLQASLTNLASCDPSAAAAVLTNSPTANNQSAAAEEGANTAVTATPGFSVTACRQALIQFLNPAQLATTMPVLPAKLKLVTLNGINTVLQQMQLRAPLTVGEITEQSTTACHMFEGSEQTQAIANSPCLLGLYLSTLLNSSSGYQFSANTPIIMFNQPSQSQANNATPLSWTEGAAYYYSVNGSLM